MFRSPMPTKSPTGVSRFYEGVDAGNNFYTSEVLAQENMCTSRKLVYNNGVYSTNVLDERHLGGVGVDPYKRMLEQ